MASDSNMDREMILADFQVGLLAYDLIICHFIRSECVVQIRYCACAWLLYG